MWGKGYSFKLCCFLFLVCFCHRSLVFGQQDFPVSPLTGDGALLVSPALVGEFSESAYISLNYKSQMKNAFNGIGTKILTAAYEQTFFKEKMALGLGIYSNTLNKSALNDFSVQLAYRYTVILGKDYFGAPTHRLSFGVEGVYRQWAFSNKNLSFGSQYDPAYAGGYNPSLSTENNFITDKKNIFDAHFGLDYKGQFTDIVSLQVGASFYHLVRPKTNFLEESARIPIRSLAYINMAFLFAEQHELKPSVSASFQADAQMVEVGAAYRYKVFFSDTYFGAGVYYRSTEVFVPTVSFGITNFCLNLSMELYMKTTYANLFMLGMGFLF